MKKMIVSAKRLIFVLAALLTMSVSASAMSYEQARNEALFLTDKMAYELNLTDAQYEAAYEINLDYLMGGSLHTLRLLRVLSYSIAKLHRYRTILSCPLCLSWLCIREVSL